MKFEKDLVWQIQKVIKYTRVSKGKKKYLINLIVKHEYVTCNK